MVRVRTANSAVHTLPLFVMQSESDAANEGNCILRATDLLGHRGTPLNMAAYQFTEYFEKKVLRKRPYLKKEWCIRVVDEPVRSEPQAHNQYRFWALCPELGGRYLHAVTLEDKVTIQLSWTEVSSHETELLRRHGFRVILTFRTTECREPRNF